MCPVHKLLSHHQPWPDRKNARPPHLSLFLPPSQFHGGSLKASDVLRPKCPDMKWSRERQEDHADVFTDVNAAHVAAQRVCIATSENKVCQCHRSAALLQQQSHVLVYSAIFTLGAILRSVITHLWQCSGDPVRNERYQGRHRLALTGMDGSSKRDKLLEMQPHQAFHTMVFKEGPITHASPASTVLSTIITDYAWRLCMVS